MWIGRARRLAELVAQGDLAGIAERVRRLLWRTERSVVLRRDLHRPRATTGCGPSFVIRPYRPKDAVHLFGSDPVTERENFGRWAALGARNCYVAELPDGRAVCLQWLVTRDEEHVLRKIGIPASADAVVLEGAYTPRRFRRLGIMPRAMARIAEEGLGFSARWALVSIGATNASMIKAARMAGFEPVYRREIRCRFFARYVVWDRLTTAADARDGFSGGRWTGARRS